MRQILHVDMDAFYASVEQRDNPSLKGRPVIVGADPREGRGRGVVAACSYEARRFGVHSALPISQAWQRCRHAVFLRPRMDAYREASRQIMEILRGYTELVEPVSLDEAFLDITGSTRLLGSAEAIATRVKNEIGVSTGLGVSLGLAPSKFLAKIASDLEKPDGFVVVKKEFIRDFLFSLPVRRLPGVGRRAERILVSMGIRTVGQLASICQSDVVAKLGAHGHRLWTMAQGHDDSAVIAHREPKSISSETTFENDESDVIVLKRTLQRLSEQVARRLRAGRFRAARVTLKLRFSSFATFTRQGATPGGVQTGQEIFDTAERLLAQFTLSEPVRLLGVCAGKLMRGDHQMQLRLFDGDMQARALANIIDSVQARHGTASLRRGSEL